MDRGDVLCFQRRKNSYRKAVLTSAKFFGPQLLLRGANAFTVARPDSAASLR